MFSILNQRFLFLNLFIWFLLYAFRFYDFSLSFFLFLLRVYICFFRFIIYLDLFFFCICFGCIYSEKVLSVSSQKCFHLRNDETFGFCTNNGNEWSYCIDGWFVHSCTRLNPMNRKKKEKEKAYGVAIENTKTLYKKMKITCDGEERSAWLKFYTLWLCELELESLL